MKTKKTAEDLVGESLYRQNILFKQTRTATPVVIVLACLALFLALFVGYSRQVDLVKSYGEGNPYNCASCKALGRACKKHRNYARRQALVNKVTMFIERYNAENYNETSSEVENASKQALYGYGNESNPDCDFCTENKSECYACRYDRKSILHAYYTVINDPVYQSKLCNKCFPDKKASCTLCKEMLLNEMLLQLTGDEDFHAKYDPNVKNTDNSAKQDN